MNNKPSETQTQLISKDWKLDHVAHAVKDMDTAIAHYRNVFGFELKIRATLDSQQVEAAYLTLKNSKIELICPILENTSLRAFLKRQGEALHHICFEVTSLEKELTRLASIGIELINSTPITGLDNKLVAFLHPHSTRGVLIELCERESK